MKRSGIEILKDLHEEECEIELEKTRARANVFRSKDLHEENMFKLKKPI